MRPQVELGAHAGRRWVKRNVEIHGIHLPVRRTVIGKTDRTSFLSAHDKLFQCNATSFIAGLPLRNPERPFPDVAALHPG
jgi:hypothetical protein